MTSPATPMLPPEVRQQMGPQAGSPSMFMQAGSAVGGPQASGPNPIDILKQKVTELEQWASDTMQLLQAIYPPGVALLAPIAQAGKALEATAQELADRLGGGPQPAPSPADIPQPNPAEGVPPGASA